MSQSSRGAINSSRPLHNPPSTRHLGHNVQNVCDVRDERMRAYACAHVAMMSVGYGM